MSIRASKEDNCFTSGPVGDDIHHSGTDNEIENENLYGIYGADDDGVFDARDVSSSATHLNTDLVVSNAQLLMRHVLAPPVRKKLLAKNVSSFPPPLPVAFLRESINSPPRSSSEAANTLDLVERILRGSAENREEEQNKKLLHLPHSLHENTAGATIPAPVNQDGEDYISKCMKEGQIVCLLSQHLSKTLSESK
jgi:hypothetical protein